MNLCIMVMRSNCIVLLASLSVLVIPVRADTLFFKSSQGNGWSTISNWFFSVGTTYVPAARLPNAPDNVVLLGSPDGEAGVYEVNTMILEPGVGVKNGAYSAHSIQMASGTSFTKSAITVLGNGQMVALPGPSGTSLSGVTLTIQGGGTLFLTNGAALTMTGGTFIYDEGGVILADKSSLAMGASTNTLDILPGAQLLSSGAAALTGGTLNQNGTVLCNSGTVEISPSTWISTNGTAKFQTVASSAVIWLDPPTVAKGDQFIVTGPGTTMLQGANVQGTIQVGAVDSGTGVFVPGNLSTTTGAEIMGSGSINVLASNGLASAFSPTNAIFNSTTIDIGPGAVFNLSAPPQYVGSAQFVSNTVNNAGTVVWTNSSAQTITFSGAATFNNLAGGTFIGTAAGFYTIGGANGSRPCTFNNSGTFQVASGTNQLTLGNFSLQFVNNGLLDVRSGTAVLWNGITEGRFNVASGAMLQFSGPTNVLNPGASFTGTGTFELLSALVVNGAVTLPNLALPTLFAAIDGPGQLTVTGPMTWNNGGIIQGAGALNIAAGGTLSINNPGGFQVLSQRTLNNSGTVNWKGGNLLVRNGAAIRNLSGGVFNIGGYGAMENDQPGPRASFSNSGTVNASGTGNSLYVDFSNAGLFQVLTQSISFPSTVANFILEQTSGSTLINGGATLNAGAGFHLLGGTLGGSGTFNGTLINAGVVHPGMPPGILTLAPGFGNSYTQSVAGILSIDIGGSTPGFQYGQLAAAGVPVSLAGSLNVNLVNGFTPSLGQQFTILTSSSRSGTFSVLNGTQLGNGLALVPVYSSANVALVVTNGVTNPCPAISLNLTLVHDGQVGDTNYEFHITASGGIPAYTFSASGQVPGVPLTRVTSDTAVFAGTPTQAGSFPFAIHATDTNGCGITRTFSVAICSPMAITTEALGAGTEGLAYRQVIGASVQGRWRFRSPTGVLALPGLNFVSSADTNASSFCILSGTPTNTGNFPVTISLTDSNGCTVTKEFTVSLLAPPQLHVVQTGNSISVDWPGAPEGGPFILQRTAQLAVPVWTNLLTTFAPPIQLPTTDASGFYRVAVPVIPLDLTDYDHDRPAVAQYYFSDPLYYWAHAGLPSLSRLANLQETLGQNPTNAFNGLMTAFDPARFNNALQGGQLPLDFSNRFVSFTVSGQPTNLAILNSFRGLVTNLDSYLLTQRTNAPQVEQIYGTIGRTYPLVFSTNNINIHLGPQTNKVPIGFRQTNINWVDVHGSDAFTLHLPPLNGPGSGDTNVATHTPWEQISLSPPDVSHDGACAAVATGASLAKLDPARFPQTVSPQFWNEFSMQLGASTTGIGAPIDTTDAYYQSLGFSSATAYDGYFESALVEADKALKRGCDVTLYYLSADEKQAHIELVYDIEVDPQDSQKGTVYTLSWGRGSTTSYDHGEWSAKMDAGSYGGWVKGKGKATFYYHCRQ